ncbi:MAG: hypothetical protein KUL75_00720 [Sterolibacterium sp.]|nr:hypothetical protein [Sterolibacterium sp.]
MPLIAKANWSSRRNDFWEQVHDIGIHAIALPRWHLSPRRLEVSRRNFTGMTQKQKAQPFGLGLFA